MRAGLGLWLTMAATTLAAGCYQPKLKNFGFVCDSSAPKPCPDGYFCRSGFCDDGTGGSPPATGGNGGDQDMAMSSGGSGGGGGGGSGGGGGGGSDDMAMSVQDMAQSIPDMAKPADMVVVSSCAHDECTTGVKLTSSCSQCVSDVCSVDSYCCTTKWDSTCITDVKSICTTKTCP
ncbi:MAG TPA: hypothetical protein VF334_08790 [Polyangia bacterium]